MELLNHRYQIMTAILSTKWHQLVVCCLLITLYSPVHLMNMEKHYNGCQKSNIRSSCIDFSTNTAPVDRELLLNPQCIQLMLRLQCSIYHVTCRNQSNQSQLFDLPCQSSCFSLYDYCMHLTSSKSIGLRPDDHINDRYNAKVPDKNQYITLERNDCLLLPAGGCDEWIEYFKRIWSHVSIEFDRIRKEVKLNERCPKEVKLNCSKMFPASERKNNIKVKYRKRDFKKKNFTIVAQVLVTQTLWAFQGSTQFHPYFRLKIKHIYRSDIPFSPGYMPTIAWPLRCICQNQLHVNQSYFLLAHTSYLYRTISLTTDSVFLPINTRYSRKIPCWTRSGRCWKRRRGRRRRRYRNRRNKNRDSRS